MKVFQSHIFILILVRGNGRIGKRGANIRSIRKLEVSNEKQYKENGFPKQGDRMIIFLSHSQSLDLLGIEMTRSWIPFENFACQKVLL